jgi:hypothetical protein
VAAGEGRACAVVPEASPRKISASVALPEALRLLVIFNWFFRLAFVKGAIALKPMHAIDFRVGQFLASEPFLLDGRAGLSRAEGFGSFKFAADLKI